MGWKDRIKPLLSETVAGLRRLHEGGLDTPGLVRWIEQVFELVISSFDHADKTDLGPGYVRTVQWFVATSELFA